MASRSRRIASTGKSRPPSLPTYPIAESSLLSDSGRSLGVLDRLARTGVNLSVDDFGTGYSSLRNLRRLPLTELKIDRSFVKQMLVDSNDFAIVHATVVLARNLGLSVVAEGVEDRETFDKLAEMGCDDAQGYYIARPMAASGFTGWLTARHSQTEVVAPVDRPIPEPSRLRVV